MILQQRTDKNIRIKVLERYDLPGVAEIHLNAFPDSLLSLLGKKTIKKFYEWQMSPPNECHAIGIFDVDQILGFCFAGSLRNSEIYFIQENILFFLGNFFSHPSIYFKKRMIVQIGSTLRNYFHHFSAGRWKRSRAQQVNRERFGVLSIGVDPKAQNLGLGRQLMEEIEKIAKRSGYQKISLSVHPDNKQAVAFYERTGWEKVPGAQNESWKGVMEKSL